MRKVIALIIFVAFPCTVARSFAYTTAGNLTITVKSSGGDFSSLDAALDFIAQGNGAFDRDTCQDPPGEEVDHTLIDCSEEDTLYTGHLIIECEDTLNDVQAAISDTDGFHSSWDSSSQYPVIKGSSNLRYGYGDDYRYSILHEWTGTALYVASNDKYLEVHDIQVKLHRPSNNDNIVKVMDFGRIIGQGGTGGKHYMHNILLGLDLDAVQSSGIDRNGIRINGSYGDSTSYTQMENVLIASTDSSYQGKVPLELNTSKYKIYNVTIVGPWAEGPGGASGYDSTSSIKNLICDDVIATSCFDIYWDVSPQSCTNWPFSYVSTGADTSAPCSTTGVQYCDPGTNPLVFENEASNDWRLDSTDDCAKDHGTSLSGIFNDDAGNQTRSGTWDIGMDEVDP